MAGVPLPNGRVSWTPLALSPRGEDTPNRASSPGIRPSTVDPPKLDSKTDERGADEPVTGGHPVAPLGGVPHPLNLEWRSQGHAKALKQTKITGK